MHRFFWMFRRIDRRKLLSIAFDFPSRMDSNNIKAHDILFGIESVCLSVCLLIGKLGKLHQNDRNAHKLNKQLISISSVTWSIRKGKVWLEWAQHLATHTNIIVNIRMHARMQHNLMGFSARHKSHINYMAESVIELIDWGASINPILDLCGWLYAFEPSFK